MPGDNPIKNDINAKSLEEAAKLIANAERPVILAGHGILLSGASKEVIELSEKGDIPLSWTLLGSGAVPASHDLNMGMMGMHGEFAANNAIQKADLLIACGMSCLLYTSPSPRD